MDWGTILQGVGAAAEGGLEGYTWAKDYEQKDRGIDSRAEIARLNAELKDMAIKAGIYKHDTASGSVVAQQQGANQRAAASNETRRSIAELNAEVQRGNESGRNERFEKGITARGLWQETQDRTRREIAGQRDKTTRRGQDIGAATAADRNETTRRGQDINNENADHRDATIRRGQDQATERARIRRGDSGGLPPLGSDDEAVRDAAIASANASNAGYSELPNMPDRPAGNLPQPAKPIPAPAAGWSGLRWRKQARSAQFAPVPEHQHGEGAEARDLVEAGQSGSGSTDGLSSATSVKDLNERRLQGLGPDAKPNPRPDSDFQPAPFERGITARGVWRHTMEERAGEPGQEPDTEPNAQDLLKAADVSRLTDAIAAVRAAKSPAERRRARAVLQALRDDAHARWLSRR